MYDYFLFYWLMWMLVIIVYFFMRRSRKQRFLLGWILLVISSADVMIHIGMIQISIGFLGVIVGTFVYFLFSPVTTKKLLITFLVMIGYGGLLMWHQIAPIWFFIPAYLMLPICMVGLVLLLERDMTVTFPVLILGMLLGQCIFQVLLIMYHLSEMIGKVLWMAQIGVGVMFMVGMYVGQWAIIFISNIVHRKLI